MTATHSYGDVTVDLLWTGGWDSTFRLLELLLVEGESVRTHYILDRDRESVWEELRTLTQIRDQVLLRLDSSRRFPPTRILLRDHLPDYPDITESFRQLKSQAAIGAQYEWLACFVRLYGLQSIELGWPRHTPPSALYCLVMKGGGADANKRPVELSDSSDVHNLFGHFSFGILDRTKEDLGLIAYRHGFADLLQQSWFCHRPIRGVPCGLCTPCHYAQGQGRPIRFSRWRWLALPRRNSRRWKAYWINRTKAVIGSISA